MLLGAMPTLDTAGIVAVSGALRNIEHGLAERIAQGAAGKIDNQLETLEHLHAWVGGEMQRLDITGADRMIDAPRHRRWNQLPTPNVLANLLEDAELAGAWAEVQTIHLGDKAWGAVADEFRDVVVQIRPRAEADMQRLVSIKRSSPYDAWVVPLSDNTGAYRSWERLHPEGTLPRKPSIETAARGAQQLGSM